MSYWRDFGTFEIDLPCEYAHVNVRATSKVWEAIYDALKTNGEKIEVRVNNVDCETTKHIKDVLERMGIEDR